MIATLLAAQRIPLHDDAGGEAYDEVSMGPSPN